MISRPTVRTILVLCEGNHCRSPMAEALLRAELGSAVLVASAGLQAMDGYPAHPEATRLMDERGLDITGHRSRQVTPDMALAADLILVMDQEEKAWCERLAPSAVGRVFLLGHWLPPGQREIPDPIQRDAAFFRSTLDRMLQALAAWHDHLHLSPEPE